MALRTKIIYIVLAVVICCCVLVQLGVFIKINTTAPHRRDDSNPTHYEDGANLINNQYILIFPAVRGNKNV